MLNRLPCLLVAVALIVAAAPAEAAKTAATGPRLSTPVPVMRDALTCNGKLAAAKRNPVLLVHGTFADSEINWSWNYKTVLPTRGETACTVDLPDRAAGDIQLSTEYVVYAIRSMASRSGRRVAILSHSQGGLEARWALRWWPDLRRLVSDVVMLAPPNDGSAFPDGLCTAPSVCAASLYQMRSDSNFLAALNRGRHAFGRVAMTSIATDADQVFVLPEQTVLGGNSGLISNVAVQDLCPADPAQHNDLPFDGPAYAIVTDALDHRGPADLSRIDQAACQQLTMPGVDRMYAEARLAAYTSTLVQLLGPTGPKADGEPPLAAYVN